MLGDPWKAHLALDLNIIFCIALGLHVNLLGHSEVHTELSNHTLIL